MQVLVVFLLHAGMTLLFKFVFFSYSIDFSSPTEAPVSPTPSVATDAPTTILI